MAGVPHEWQNVEMLKTRMVEGGVREADFDEPRIGLEEVGATLGDDEAVVAVHVGRRAIFVIALRTRDAVFKRVEIENGLVEVMCQEVVRSATFSEDGELPDFDLVNSLQVHDLVFRPLESFLKPGSHLLILPDGPLWTLPFGCLVTSPMIVEGSEDAQMKGQSANQAARDEGAVDVGGPVGANRLMGLRRWLDAQGDARAGVVAVTRAQAWLADRYRMSVMPSFVPLTVRGSQTAGTQNRKPFLGFGDPANDGQQSATYVAVPETRRLVAQLAVELGGDPGRDIFVGKAATTKRLLELSESGELARRRVLCFATHAIYPREDGDLLMDAGLLFSDGEILTGFDAAGLRMDADFVLLTACFTGSPSGRSITVPLSGLAQAFLNAGARSLLISHWPIEVSATERFVSTFAASLGQDTSLVDALRTAEQSIRVSANTELCHPAFWAGFSIVGDGARRVGSVLG
jgi:CHAT domain-containing protein